MRGLGSPNGPRRATVLSVRRSVTDDAVARRLTRKFATTDRPAPWQFVLYGGIGDQVLWLSLLPSFRRRTTRKVVVYYDPLAADVVRLFAGRSFDRAIEVDALDGEEVARLREQQRFEPGTPLLAWHWSFVGDEIQYLAAEHRTIADLIRQLLRLPPDAPIDRPVWPRAAREEAAGQMRRLGLPAGRTMLIAPWAKSSSVTLPLRWWTEVARHFAARGFAIATNIGNRGRGFDRLGMEMDLAALPGTVAADVPLRDLGPFAECCGNVICMRSGLSDLLAFSKARMCVVWPHEVRREIFFRKLFAIWSVERIYGAHEVVEVHAEVSAPLDAAVLPAWVAGG